jgi:hypothetical protein
MGASCDIASSAMVHVLGQLVPRYCQHLGIPSISEGIVKLDYNHDGIGA